MKNRINIINIFSKEENSKKKLKLKLFHRLFVSKYQLKTINHNMICFIPDKVEISYYKYNKIKYVQFKVGSMEKIKKYTSIKDMYNKIIELQQNFIKILCPELEEHNKSMMETTDCDIESIHETIQNENT